MNLHRLVVGMTVSARILAVLVSTAVRFPTLGEFAFVGLMGIGICGYAVGSLFYP